MYKRQIMKSQIMGAIIVSGIYKMKLKLMKWFLVNGSREEQKRKRKQQRNQTNSSSLQSETLSKRLPIYSLSKSILREKLKNKK